MASPEAEALARPNNLTVSELVQPFGKLSNDVTLKDPEGANHSVSGMAVQFTDWHKARWINFEFSGLTENFARFLPLLLANKCSS